MQKSLKIILSLFLVLSFGAFLYGSSFVQFFGEYRCNITNLKGEKRELATLKVEYAVVSNIIKDPKSGKRLFKKYKRSEFSLSKSGKEKLLSARLIIDGQNYDFINDKQILDLDKKFSFKNHPKSATLILTFSMGTISKAFKTTEKLKFDLDWSDVRGSHGEGKVLIEKVK